ncbi:hypothetical protein L208DRAFT_56982 [Tricholoma matsutake]|nr:hypothetical protein L208DRAFT_56982 [Tricholoma matsutake 945]
MISFDMQCGMQVIGRTSLNGCAEYARTISGAIFAMPHETTPQLHVQSIRCSLLGLRVIQSEFQRYACWGP